MQLEEEVDKALTKLVPSSIVFVELATPAGQTAKFKTRLVGYLQDMFILLKMPNLLKNPKLSAFFSDCAHITVRSVVEGHEGLIIAFQTQIKFQVKSPTPMMVLSIPQKVAVQQLRKVNRLDTALTVDAKIKNNSFSGTMLNISPLGCLIDVRGITQDFAIQDGEDIEIDLTSNELEKTGKLQGSVCNVKKNHIGEHLGIKFKEESEDTVMTLLNQILFHASH